MKAGSTSLRFRLLVGTLVWVAATVGIAGWVLQSMFEQQLSRQFDNELSMHLAQLAAHLETDVGGNPVLARPLSDPRLERPYSGLYWQVERMAADNSGAIMLRSRSLWDAQLPVPADRLADGERHTHRVSGPDGEALRMLEQVMQPAEGPDQSWRLIVAADERLLSEPVDRFRTLLIGALALLALGLMVAAAFQVVAGLRPLKRLRDELSLLRDGQRTTLSEDHPSEIQPLVDELNAVLNRNAAFVTRARHQAGNLAHAVKTPLAVMANAAAEADGPRPGRGAPSGGLRDRSRPGKPLVPAASRRPDDRHPGPRGRDSRPGPSAPDPQGLSPLGRRAPEAPVARRPGARGAGGADV